MTTRDIDVRLSEVGISAEGIISLKAFDEDATIYHSNAIGDVVVRTGFPNNSVAAPGSTILRLMDIATLRDEDDGPGFYAGVRGVTASWAAAMLFESDDDTADYANIKTLDVAAPIGFAKTLLTLGSTVLWDYSTLEVEMLGDGALESFTENETLKGEVAYLVGRELVLNQNVTQLTATRWRLDGPMVRGYKGTEWAIGTHAINERFVVLTSDTIRRINDALIDLDLPRTFKAVTSGQSLENAQAVSFINTGVSLKPYSPVDIAASFDGSDNILGTFNRRSRLVGRNGRDFFDPPLGEETESYEIDILADNELTVKRTLLSATPAFFYAIADQTTDFGARKDFNLHVNIHQMSAAVGRGYPGHAILHPSGASGTGEFDMLFEDGNQMFYEDGVGMEFEH